MSEQTDPTIKPDRARVAPTFTALLVGAVALVSTTATVVLGYAQFRSRLDGLDARVGDLPKREDITTLRRELRDELRALLEQATWRCPPAPRRGPPVWVDCTVTFRKER
jgi:hypothetical protein